ncbi:MAG: DsrE family protein [Planctomycetota bacterium]|jgi:intracellular sulfur oxidation DsrE/DsrF family protein
MKVTGPQASTLVMITNDGMGQADPDLRHRLMRTWLTLVEENGQLPGAVAFYTNGVRLVVEGSPVLDLLQSLEARGVRLVICKTCLDAFGLTEQVRVGVGGGMGDIIAAQWKAEKVVTL